MKYFKKAIIVFLSLFLLLTVLVTYINSNIFSKNLDSILKDLNLNMTVGKVELAGYGKIKITDLVMYDKAGNPAIDAKEAYIYVDPLNIARVKKIDVYSPKVIFEKYENMKFNITEMFIPEKQKKGKDRSNRLGKINFYNAKLDYRDKSYDKLIQKNLDNVNGYVLFSKESGIVVQAAGKNTGENGEIEGIGVVFKSIYPKHDFYKGNDGKNNTIYLELNFDNFGLFEEAAQYVPVEGLTVYDGRLTGTLKMGANKKFSGHLSIKDGDIKYKDYDDLLKKVQTEVELKSNNADVRAKAGINGGVLDLGIKFFEKTKKVALEIKSENLDYKDIRKYKLVKDMNIDAQGRVSGIINGDLDINKKIYEFNGNITSDKIKYGTFNFGNVDVDFNYDKNNNLNFNKIRLFFGQKISSVYIAANADASFVYNTKSKEGYGSYNLNNVNSDFSIKNISGELSIDKNTVVSSNFYSDEIDGNFRYDTKAKNILINTTGKKFFNLKYGENSFDVKPTLNYLSINMDKFTLVSGTGDVELNKNKYFDYVKAAIKVNNGNFDINAAVNISGQKFNATGTTDSKFNHNYVVSGENIAIKPLLKRFNVKINDIDNLNITTDVNAKIHSVNGKLGGNFELNSRRGKYIVEYEKLNVTGNIEDLAAGNLRADMSVSEIWVNYQRFKNLRGEVAFRDNTLVINNLNSENIQADLTYDLKREFLNINGRVKDYVIYNVSSTEFNLYLKTLNFELSGPLKALDGNIILEPSMVTIDNRNIGMLKGNMTVTDSILNIKELGIRENSVTGTYDLNTQNADLTVHINEDNPEDIYGISELKLDIGSDLRLQGKLNDFNISGFLNINNIQYGDFKLPKVEMELDYRNGDIAKILKKGSLEIKKFVLRGEEGEEILNTKSKVEDLETANLNFVINDQELDLESIKGFSEKGYSGKIKYSVIINGNIDEFFLDFKASSENFTVSGFAFNNLELDAQINNQGLNIGKFYLEYENNPLFLDGYVTFSPIDYNISIIAENFNLEFLKAGKDVKEASGVANLDLVITPENTSGKINIDNFTYKDKGSVDISDLNADIDIVNRKLKVNNFQGNYNGGTVNIYGDLDVPSVSPDFAKTKKVDLGDFDLTIILDKVNIKYGKTFDGIVSTNLGFTESALIGTIDIEKGSITDVSQFLEGKAEKSKKEVTLVEGIQGSIMEVLAGQYTAYIQLNIVKGIDVNISRASLIRNLKGVVRGEANISYIGGNLNAVGSFDLLKGNFYLNNRKFRIETAEVRYGNQGMESSLTNPFVVLVATSTINNTEIIISADGELSDLKVKFNSSAGLTQDQILSLLLFDEGMPEDTGENQDLSNEKLGNLLDLTLNQLIFNQVIDKIEETFGLDVGVKTNWITDSNGNTSGSGFETSLYLRDSLYKDRFYWNVELTYGGEQQELSSGLDYNFWVTYKVSEKFGVNLGIENLKSTDTIYEDQNYYLGVEFSTRFDTFGDFVRSIKKPKLKVITDGVTEEQEK